MRGTEWRRVVFFFFLILSLKAVDLADIISIDSKRTAIRSKQADQLRRRKLLAVRKVFQCAHCVLKCEKCGTQISDQTSDQTSGRAPGQPTNDGGADTNPVNSPHVPYRFCESCALEYLDYIDRLKGNASDCYWHNDAWLQSWHCWIDYQSAVDRYLNSREFQKLLDELKQTGRDR